jgi:hypothetical protein
VGEILSLVSLPPTTLSSSNLGPKGSVISFQERPERRIILHFLESAFPDTRTEREREREMDKTWSECDLEQQQVSRLLVFFLHSNVGPRQLFTSDYCVCVCFCAISSPQISRYLSLSLHMCVSLSLFPISPLSGEIGKLSHFFVIKLTKQEIVLKLR